MANTTDFVSALFDDTSNPSKITVGLTMAVKALEKGHSASVILFIDAVKLAKPNALDGVDVGAPFKPAKDLLEKFIEQGGNVLVCGACMEHNGIAESDIDTRFEVINGGDVVDLMMAAKGSLQLS
ncbi:DsrE family protein [Psychrobacter sp. FDAARGOS_221]|uniref:DsrE family protein n=1 Tax=Psychrobacter sp. FDAARGOS_221 TaxID=1975705 RepID=UPI000BB54F43|nr:DsrE family protein [Psychrobacter sp. FDAARGOS_221]PNK60610.1 sulfur reduction protein DsrE [Psychrobacter sp. FDAARGOS_221]